MTKSKTVIQETIDELRNTLIGLGIVVGSPVATTAAKTKASIEARAYEKTIDILTQKMSEHRPDTLIHSTEGMEWVLAMYKEVYNDLVDERADITYTPSAGRDIEHITHDLDHASDMLDTIINMIMVLEDERIKQGDTDALKPYEAVDGTIGEIVEKMNQVNKELAEHDDFDFYRRYLLGKFYGLVTAHLIASRYRHLVDPEHDEKNYDKIEKDLKETIKDLERVSLLHQKMKDTANFWMGRADKFEKDLRLTKAGYKQLTDSFEVEINAARERFDKNRYQLGSSSYSMGQRDGFAHALQMVENLVEELDLSEV